MDDESRTVWCGNLSDEVTEETLYELFLQAAPLQRVHIPHDKEGRKSNYAFIVFKHLESVLYAVELLKGTSLFNKPLNIKPRSKNLMNDHQNHYNNRDRFQKPTHDSQRRRDVPQFHGHQEPYFENLIQMGQMMNMAVVQPTYSSSVDRRPNHFTDSRNNRHHQRDDRKPYNRNNQKFNRNNNRNYEKQRYY